MSYIRIDAARAVVSDDGWTISLTAYCNGAAVPVALSPVRAIAIADELIRAALPKLESTSDQSRPVPEEKLTKRRGGDPHAQQRHELQDGLRGMASLLGLGNGRTAAEVAREMIQPLSAAARRT